MRMYLKFDIILENATTFFSLGVMRANIAIQNDNIGQPNQFQKMLIIKNYGKQLPNEHFKNSYLL